MIPKIAEIAAQLEQSRESMLETIAGVDAPELHTRPTPEAWSVGEILHHLSIVEAGTARIIAKAFERGRDTGLGRDPSPDSSVLDSLERAMGPESEEPRSAPPTTLPRPEIPRSELLRLLAASRADLLASMTLVGDYDLRGLQYPHPALGPLDLYQWMLFCVRHERRHTRQIRRVLASIGEPRREAEPDPILPSLGG